jgi:hypothetical protein
LVIRPGTNGAVVFAHCSGNSGHSPRDQFAITTAKLPLLCRTGGFASAN